MLKIPCFGVILAAGLVAVVKPASTQSVSSVLDANSRMNDLVGLHSIPNQPQTTAQTPVQRTKPQAKTQKWLVYQSAKVKTSVNMVTLTIGKLPYSKIGADRQVELERYFSDSTGQLAIADISCPNKLSISQVGRYGKRGQRISASAGDDVIQLEPAEKTAVLQFICSNKSSQLKPSPENGNCAFGWQRDSMGRRCADRVPGRR